MSSWMLVATHLVLIEPCSRHPSLSNVCEPWVYSKEVFDEFEENNREKEHLNRSHQTDPAPSFESTKREGRCSTQPKKTEFFHKVCICAVSTHSQAPLHCFTGSIGKKLPTMRDGLGLVSIAEASREATTYMLWLSRLMVNEKQQRISALSS